MLPNANRHSIPEHLTLLRPHAAALIKVDLAATTAAVIRKSLFWQQLPQR